MDKFRLIEEVRERPILWNSLHYRPYQYISDSWKQVAESLGGNVTPEACRSTWNGIRGVYREIYFDIKKRKRTRIEIDKQIGAYDPKKNYDSKWVYYEHMHFLQKVFMHKEQKLENVKVATIEFVESNKSSNMSVITQDLQDPALLKTTGNCNSSSNGNDVSSNDTNPETTLYEIHITDDSDKEEFLENHEIKKEFRSNDDESCEEYQYDNSHLSKNSTPKQNPRDSTTNEPLNQNFYQNENVKTDQAQLSKRQESEKYSDPKDVDNLHIKEEPVSEIESDSHNEDYNIICPTSSKRQRLMETISKPKQTNVEIIDINEAEPIIRTTQGSEDKSYQKEKVSSQQRAQIPNVDIKEEPVIDIEADTYPLEESSTPPAKRKRVENELKFSNQHSSPKQKHTENTNLKRDKECYNMKNNISQHSSYSDQNIGDADYKFLLSFSSHLKSLTVLQNLQFRAQMSDLMLSFLTTSSSANGLKTPESNTKELSMNTSDPDCNFLISFWPYMKSLNQLQNLQYRAKMSHIIIDILSKDRL